MSPPASTNDRVTQIAGSRFFTARLRNLLGGRPIMGLPDRGVRQHALCAPLGTRGRYPWDFVCRGIEPVFLVLPPPALLLLTLARCPGCLKLRRRRHGTAQERSPLESPAVCRLSPGEGSIVQ